MGEGKTTRRDARKAACFIHTKATAQRPAGKCHGAAFFGLTSEFVYSLDPHVFDLTLAP